MLFNCCIVSALKHLLNGRVLSALHLFIEHKNDLIQLCFVFMSRVHMTFGCFDSARSKVFSSHSAQILGGYRRQQPKSAMEQPLSTAAKICHEAITVDSKPKSAMERPPWSSPPWSRMPWDLHGACQLGADRHGAGCLEVTLEPAAMELAARGLWPQYVDLITGEVL
jgi:hypothetical protein